MTAVSIVILNHNYARYLPAAIASAFDQRHQPTEVIVVDDASTDDSGAVIESHGSDIVPVFHQVNRGQGAAINSGFRVASGDMVWFLDADDLLLPDACATAAAALDADHDLAKFHTPLAIVDADGTPTGVTLPAEPARLATGDIRDHVFRFRAHGWPPMSGNAYAMRALSRLMPVPAETYRQAADSYLNEQAAVCGTLASCTEPVAAYRRHGGNQFAGQPVTLGWLRTKIERELCSHQQLGLLAWQLDLEGYRPNVADVEDVAFLGYRMASVRLDPAGHPPIDERRPDGRFRLAVDGIRAAVTNPQLATRDRILRTAWFLAAALVPDRWVEPLLARYLPDGPSEPVWRRRRARTPTTTTDDRLPGGEQHG